MWDKSRHEPSSLSYTTGDCGRIHKALMVPSRLTRYNQRFRVVLDNPPTVSGRL
jgi:hypothetical protein